MVDANVVARRVLAMNEALADLARPEAGDANALATDRMLRAAVERWLQIAIEAAVDLAFHAIAGEGWTPPDSARGAFALLASHGKLSPELARRLGLAAGLRNLLVHDYVSVDLESLARTVRTDLGDLSAFARVAASWLPAPRA